MKNLDLALLPVPTTVQKDQPKPPPVSPEIEMLRVS